MKKNKILKNALLVLCTVALTACGGATKTPPENADAPATSQQTAANTETADASSEIKEIGIIQIVNHDALDASREGFIKALEDKGFKDKENINIDYRNAEGDQSTLKTISQKFVSDKKDLILAVATPSAVSIASETKEIPIIVTAITNPEGEKLVVSNEKPDTNVTGTSDLNPIKEQVDLLVKLLPDAKKIAVLFNSGESNSEYQYNVFKEHAAAYNLDVTAVTFSSKTDITTVAQSLIGKYDALYLPTDNDVASAAESIGDICISGKLPAIAGEEGILKGACVASISIDYYDLGYRAGEMAVDVLEGKSKPQDMPIEYAPRSQLMINKRIADKIGITIPEEVGLGAVFFE